MTTETIRIIRTDMNGNYISNSVPNSIVLKLSIAIAKATAQEALYMTQAVYHCRQDNRFYKIVRTA